MAPPEISTPPVTPAGETTAAADWLLWQLADSAFPTGGFAHGGGLEAAWQHGEVRNAADLQSFLAAALHQIAAGPLCFVTAGHREPAGLPALDHCCDAFTNNHVTNRASRLQGRALIATADRVFALPALRALRPGGADAPPCGHLAPVFGVVTRVLQLTQAAAGRLFLFWQLRGLTSGAVRLGVVGPLEAQAIQYQLTPLLETVWLAGRDVPVAAAAQTAPLLDLWQGAQDRLYSRLFQS